MGDYQKELAIHKLDKATEMLDILTTRDRSLLVPEHQIELRLIIDLITKAKEHVENV